MDIQLERKNIIRLKNILNELYTLHGNEWFVVELSSIVDDIIIQEQSLKQENK